MYKYKFSIIMAVYNVESFLPTAIQSVLDQSIGFEHIQLILVDDGSSDGSGRICDEYADRYPDNIFVIHKENGGVSSARNIGLSYAQGQFVNFMDSDDKIDQNTAKNIYNFFCTHYEKTDMVSFPMKFFDGSSGDHILNYKYKNGDRIIDLDSEWGNPQLSLSSAFVKLEAIRNLRFDSRLCFAEDAKVVQQILSRKRTLGVVSDAVYWYRRRSTGAQSAVQSSELRKEWYLPYMRHFQRETIEYYLERMQNVPLFVQNTLMYDLQWRIKQPHIPRGVLTEEEQAAYLAELKWVLGYIDDTVIEAQKNIFREHKALAFSLKYGKALRPGVEEEDRGLLVGDRVKFKLSEAPLKLEFFEDSADTCTLEGIFFQLPNIADQVEIFAMCNGVMYQSEIVGKRKPTMGLGQVIQEYISFNVQIPLTNDGVNNITFFCRANGVNVPLKQIRFGTFFPISEKYSNSCYCSGKKWLLSYQKPALSVIPYSRRKHARMERAFCKELWKRNAVGAHHAVLMRAAVRLLKPFKRKPLLLVSDRVMNAGDNGEAFFRYMRENHREVNTFFVISGKSPDYEAMKNVGPVLKTDSHLHKLLLLLSDCIVSSSAEAEVYNPFFRYHEPYRALVADKKFVFLQHGVIKDDLSEWAGRFNKNISGFITSAKPEYDSIRYGAYEYGDDEVWLTGLPRFDRLYRDEQKWITVMPTWRRYLMGKFNQKTDTWSLIPDVENSAFVRFYSALLNDERLLRKAKEYGYRLKFLPHPNFQSHLYLFRQNPEVDYLGRDMQYREIYAKSELVITDYSSAIFDFLYLRKPIIYTHFDHEAFFAGEHIYSKGYFDYERDGFGEVEYDLEGTIDRIIEYMENGCQLKPFYRDRVEKFFAFNDRNNCQRVYDKIKKLCRF